MSKRALLRLTTSICFMLCVMIFGQVTVFADEVKPIDANTEWTILSSMSIVRNYFQTEEIDGKIYAIGGFGLSSAEVYDPTTDKWTTLSSMSIARGYLQTEVINGKIYAIGGESLSSVEVYDPTTDKWTTLSSMSIARRSFQTEVVDGKIYAIGGQLSNQHLTSSVEVYDPTTDKWTTLSSMSIARGYFQTEVINGKIYAIGGYDSYLNMQSSIEVYDPATDKWTTLSSMSESRIALQTEVINDKIYAIGGTRQTMEVYNPTTDKWTILSSMSKVKRDFQTVVENGKIYAIGGENSSLTEIYNPTTDKWTTLSSMSIARRNFQTEVINGNIYAVGGYGNPSMEVYTVNTATENQLKAEAGKSKVDLTWNTVDKATSYTIKRSTTAGGPYTTIASDITDTSYTDTNVANGTTYYYIVSATNNGTEISDSNEASAEPIADQTPPATEAKLKVVLEVAESLRLSVDDDLNVNTQMSWSSSEPTVATVNEKGIVTALAPGNSVITVKNADGSYMDNINVLVVENADDYRLAIDLKIGETARLTADDFTNTANISWAPMDSSIANVTSKGKVTALSKGLVLISSKDADGNIIGRVYVRVRE